MKKERKGNWGIKLPFTERFYALSLIVTFVSFLGFTVENVWMILNEGYIDNRNMYLPLLFGYGLAVLAIYLLFGTPREPRFILKKMNIKNTYAVRAVYFALIFVCICVGETLFGLTVEWTCGFSWWSYENMPLNLGTYTSIPTSCAFSVIILLFMDFVFTPMYNFFISLNPKLLKWLSLSFISLMTADFVHSGVYMLTKRDVMRKWRLRIFEKGLLHIIAPK